MTHTVLLSIDGPIATITLNDRPSTIASIPTG